MLVVVGSYPGSARPYGTFDQAGNVFEFHEDHYDSWLLFRGVRGGSWYQAPIWLGADRRDYPNPRDGLFDVGFRLASVPEPSGLALLGLALLRRRARRTKKSGR